MKKWIKRTATALCALGLSLPMPILAAGKDSVTLEQTGDWSVAVTIGTDQTAAEETTAISLQLKVTVTEGQADVAFEFADGIPADAAGSRYSDGILHIYAASGDERLFQDGSLSLGRVVMTETTADTRVEVGAALEGEEYLFQTTNSLYGKQDHIVSGIPESVTLYAGSGSTPDPDTPEGGTPPDSGSGQEHNGSSDSAGGTDGSENIQQGLNDTTTQQVTNPNEAVKLPAAVILPQGNAPLPDLSQTEKPETEAVKAPGGRDKVTVVKPEEGPVSIVVEEEKELAAQDGQKPDGTAASQGEESSANGKNEIALDQVNGGALQQDDKKSNAPLIVGTVTAACAAGAAGGYLLRRKKAARTRRRRRR